MSRLPQIGDHVWRVVDGKTVFDGYVADGDHHAVSGWRSAWCVPTNIIMESSSFGAQEFHIPHHAPQIVAHIFLVRQLHGWRWVPHDLRPEVRPGDVLTLTEGETVARFLVTHEVAAAGHYAFVTPLNDAARQRLTARCDVVYTDEALLASEAAKALAGIDGWSWEPARWPGEPK